MKINVLLALLVTAFFSASSMTPAPAPVLDTTHYYTMLKLDQDFIDFINQADSKLSGSILDNKMLEAISLIKDESQKNRTGRTDPEKNRIHNEMQKLENAIDLLKDEDINKILTVLGMNQQNLAEIKGYTTYKNKIRFEIKTRLSKELSTMILKAYKFLSLKLHPDKNSSISQELFKELSNAKEIADPDFRLTYNKYLSSDGHAQSVEKARRVLKQKESARAQQQKSSHTITRLDTFNNLIIKNDLTEDEYAKLIRYFCGLIVTLPQEIEDSDLELKSIKNAINSFLKNRVVFQIVGNKMSVNKEGNKKFIEKLEEIIVIAKSLKLTDWLIRDVKNDHFRGIVRAFLQDYLVTKINEAMAMPGAVNSEVAHVVWEILSNAMDPRVMKLIPDCLDSVLSYFQNKLQITAQSVIHEYENNNKINLVEEFFEEFFKLNQKDSINNFIQRMDKINKEIRIQISRSLLFLSKALANKIEKLSAVSLSDQDVENVVVFILKLARKNFLGPDDRIKKIAVLNFFENFLKIRFLSNRKSIWSKEILLSQASAASKLYLDIDEINLENLGKFIPVLAQKLGSKNEHEFAQILHENYTFDKDGCYERALIEFYKINRDSLRIAWMSRVLEAYEKKVTEKADLNVNYKYKQENKAYSIVEIITSLSECSTKHTYRYSIIGRQCFDLLKNFAEFIASQESIENFDIIKNSLITGQIVPNNFFENKPKPEVKPIKKDELKLSKKMKKLADSLTQLKEKLRHLLGYLKTLKKNIKKPAH